MRIKCFPRDLRAVLRLLVNKTESIAVLSRVIVSFCAEMDRIFVCDVDLH